MSIYDCRPWRPHPLPFHMQVESGLETIKTIKTTTALASSDINKNFNVNLWDSTVTVTLPPLALWSEGDHITLLIKVINFNHNNNCLIIEGIDKDAMPDCWNGIDGIYDEWSWIVIRKTDADGGFLYVEDYYDPVEEEMDPLFGDIAW